MESEEVSIDQLQSDLHQLDEKLSGEMKLINLQVQKFKPLLELSDQLQNSSIFGTWYRIIIDLVSRKLNMFQ